VQVDGARPVDTQVAGRLWDAAPDGATQTLVARGVLRPTASGSQSWELHPGAWRFEPGHVAKLELLGSDSPFLRPSNGSFSTTVAALRLRLPIHERQSLPRARVRLRLRCTRAGLRARATVRGARARRVEFRLGRRVMRDRAAPFTRVLVRATTRPRRVRARALLADGRTRAASRRARPCPRRRTARFAG
jgi:hypothetical protein